MIIQLNSEEIALHFREILRMFFAVFTVRNRSCGKVMFLQVSVIVFTGGGGGVVSQHALQVSKGVYPSMPCRSPGPHPGGFQAQTWGGSRPTPGGVFRPTPRGVYPSMHIGRPPWLTATAVGGTHPTGMHSCFFMFP